MADADGKRPTPAELLERAEAWRPWRAYAAQHLWAADAAEPQAAQSKRTKTDARQQQAA
jgi:AraC family transcriptional regulator of adaptative response / DNA-3-methyladenine glycosylase II